MNKSLLLFGMGAILCSSVAYAAPRKEAGKNEKFKFAKEMARKVNARNAADQEIWRAGSVTNYQWDYDEWIQYNAYKCSYYPNGLLKEEVSEEGYRNFYEYDSEGRLITITFYISSYGDEEEIECIQTFEYDSVIKDLVVYSSEEYPLYDYGYGYGREISRNDLGNITMVRSYNSWQGDITYSGDALLIEYGDDNKANRITYQYTYEDWETGEEETDIYSILDNIVWENTDGQIYEVELNEPLSKAFIGANRIKSASCIDEELPYPANLTAEYDGVNYKVLIELETGEKVSETEFTSLDEYGSYQYYEYAVDYDFDEGEFYIDATQESTATYVVDKFGLILEDSFVGIEHYEEGDEVYSAQIKAEVTYDELHGYPVEYIISSKSDFDDDLVLQEKIVYADYENYGSTVGVESISNSNNDQVEFFNMNGVRVINPTNGIFIRRQGDKVTKVFVK